VLLALLLAACGGSSGDKGDSTTGAAAIVSSSTPPEPAMKPGVLSGPLQVSAHAAPPIALHDQDGKAFTLASLRGKAVFVTFVYAHCPDVCPLLLQTLGAAKRKLKDPASMQILAVSVDPKGDTPATVKTFLRKRLLTGKVRWLLGTRAQLRTVWHAWGIEVDPSLETPAIVEHLAIIYGVDARGRVRVGYPASPLKSAWIDHDAPILARAT
jgi:protein SCO1/2